MNSLRDAPLTDAEKVVYATTYALEIHRKTSAGVEGWHAGPEACEVAFEAVTTLRAARGRIDRHGDENARAKMYDQIAAPEED